MPIRQIAAFAVLASVLAAPLAAQDTRSHAPVLTADNNCSSFTNYCSGFLVPDCTDSERSVVGAAFEANFPAPWHVVAELIQGSGSVNVVAPDGTTCVTTGVHTMVEASGDSTGEHFIVVNGGDCTDTVEVCVTGEYPVTLLKFTVDQAGEDTAGEEEADAANSSEPEG